MRIYTFFITLFIFCAMHVHAQKALTPDEKFAMVKEVYDRVFAAMGIVDIQPELVLDDKRETSVAYLKRNKDGSRTLAIEQKAFDICMGFGDRAKDALAFLIGHELGHFRYNHQWGKDFASSFALADIEDKLATANDKLGELKYFETQADHSGGISCFLAGYDIRGLGEPLLRKVYAEYKLPEETPKYPSLRERILLTQQNDSIIAQLITVFETGNYAMMVSEYTGAIKCFEFVLNKGFKSREMYNNLGVCYLLQAMNLLGKDAVKYVYPVEIDVESRVNGNAKGFSDEVKGLIEKAKTYFSLTTQLDKEYSTGFINMACAHSLAGEIEDGKYAAQKAMKLLQRKYMDQSKHIHAYILLGILYDQEKNPREAKTTLEQGLKITNSYLAQVNLEIIKGKKAEEFKYNKKFSKEKLERYTSDSLPAGLTETISDITNLQDDVEALDIKEIEMGKSSCYYVWHKNSVIYNLGTGDGHELYFQETGNAYAGETSKGIKRGSLRNDVLEQYGLPDITYTTRGSTIFVYKAQGILFTLGSNSTIDKNERVKSWAVWKRY